MLRWFVNSLLAGVANTVLIVVVDSLAAYALARMDFLGKRLIFGTVVGTIFLPAFVFLVPNFLIVSQLGWLDSLWAIIVPSAGGAFGVFFLRQFFCSLPRELEEAAVHRRRQPVDDLHPGGPAAVPAGAGHPGRAVVPHQLERLPVAGLRAVQRRTT